MKGFICVYLHPQPKPKALNQTKLAAQNNGLLREFIERYQKRPNFYDWGDDPSFFLAEKLLGKPEYASWGVCRRDVRKQIEIGHLVVFFCARHRTDNKNGWDYFYVGFGTVAKTFPNRQKLWDSTCEYSIYQQFFNTLVGPGEKGEMVHYETIYPFHKDWENRIRAPYVIFDPAVGKSHFNLKNPLHIAVYENKHLSEIWRSNDSQVAELKSLLFNQDMTDRKVLRIENRLAHRHIPLCKKKEPSEARKMLIELRESLFNLSKRVM